MQCQHSGGGDREIRSSRSSSFTLEFKFSLGYIRPSLKTISLEFGLVTQASSLNYLRG